MTTYHHPTTSWSTADDHDEPTALLSSDLRVLVACALAFLVVLAYAVVQDRSCMAWAAGDPERVELCQDVRR